MPETAGKNEGLLMKMWKKVLAASALALCLISVSKADSKAAGLISGVAQTDDSSSSVGISWNAYLGTDNYVVSISNDAVNWVVADNYNYSPKTSLYGLSAGSTYYVKVTAYNDDKALLAESAPLEVVTAPSGSLNAFQSGATTSSVSVASTGLAGANYYILAKGYSSNSVILAQSNTPVVTAGNLSAATSEYLYYYAAKKASTGYVAVGSNSYIRTTTLSGKLSTKQFGITTLYPSINVYYFATAALGDNDGIQYQFATTSGKVKKTVDGGSSLRIADFINGTFYKFRVRTYVNCGATRAYSAWSDYKYVGMSKSIKATLSKNKKGIRLNWSKVSGAKSFAVYSSTKEKSGYKKIKNVSAKKRSITVTKVNKKKIKKNHKYYFKVVALSKSGKKTLKSSVYYIDGVSVY